MERYDNIVKLEEIRRFVDHSQYKKAEKILDTVDLHKIKSLTDLSIIADVYTQNERYEEAVIILNKMYAKTKTRRILYQLVEVSIKQGNITEAEKYLSQYIKVSPNDSCRLIFRYCIDKRKGESLEVLIETLEQLKEFEYIENWAYELAKLYHKAGKKDMCIRECSDIALWFGEGLYVEKAKLLKAYYVGELDPIHMLKAKEKKEAEQRLGLDKTKDFSSVRSQIDQFLEEEEALKASVNEQPENEQFEDEQTEDKQSENEQTEDIQSEDKQTEDIQSENELADSTETGNNVYDDQVKFEETIKDIADEEELDQKLQEYILTGEIEIQEPISTKQPMSAFDHNETADSMKYDVADIDNSENYDTENYDTENCDTENYDTENCDTENGDIDNANIESVSTETSKDNIGNAEISDYADEIFNHFEIDYKKILGYYYELCKVDIPEILIGILSDQSKNKHLIITGERGTGKTSLAKKISKIMFGAGRMNSPKVAKINGEKLNQIDLEQKADKLIDSTLIIEDVSCLNSNAIKQLLQLIRKLNSHIFVVLEDTSANIEKLLEMDTNLKALFPYLLHLQNYSRDELFGLAEGYVKEQDYLLTEEAAASLFHRIQDITEEVDKSSQLSEVMEIIKGAKHAADERYKHELLKVIGEREIVSTDFMYIIPADFNS
ncbi:MAG: hypothetical protein K0R92_575 [Lachnospiraceae bacterium]|jgi:hypothetical protein|nr:hypothetical protein [Lachnospiraceae bacterium]